MSKESAKLQISFKARSKLGRGDARALRRQGFIPAVVFGRTQKPFHIYMDSRHVDRAIDQGHFRSRVLSLEQQDEQDKASSFQVLAKDLQYHPVSDRIEHIDFQVVDEKTRIRVEVQVRAINEDLSPGLRVGGVLNMVRHTVDVICQAGAIPQELQIDLEGRQIGDSIHISHVPLPAGVKPVITDRDFTIATIAGVGTAGEATEEDVEESAESSEKEQSSEES